MFLLNKRFREERVAPIVFIDGLKECRYVNKQNKKIEEKISTQSGDSGACDGSGVSGAAGHVILVHLVIFCKSVRIWYLVSWSSLFFK